MSRSFTWKICFFWDWVFWLKVFKDTYFLNLWLDSFDTFTVVRCWSTVLLSTWLSELDVKVVDLENWGGGVGML